MVNSDNFKFIDMDSSIQSNESNESIRSNKQLTLDEIGLKYIGPSVDKNNIKRKYIGGDKTSIGQNFTKFYDEILNKFRNENIKFMEIGIFNGKSIAMWADYFENGTIYGVDINLKTFYGYRKNLIKDGAFKNRNIEYIVSSKMETNVNYPKSNDKNIKIIECDTFSPEFTNIVHNYLREFDIILDDGNHLAKYQYHNFDLLFDYLKQNGIYIIEDIDEPNELFSFGYFGYIINSLSNLKNTKISKIKSEYVNNHIKQYTTEYAKIKNSFDRITESILTKTDTNIINKMNEAKVNYENRMKLLEPILNNKKILENEFDEIIKRKNHLIGSIDHIEIRANNVIIYKK